MKELLKLYGELLPVMAFIPIGYWVKKKFNVQAKYISAPLIKVLLPLVVFFNVLDAEAQKLYILPVITFILALSMNPVANFAHKKFAQDMEPLLLRSSFSFFNIAFFGIPTVTALFGEKDVSNLICIYLGSALYGDTIGYFQVAKTKLSKSEAIKKVLQIPFLYVFVAAMICKVLEVETPEFMKAPIKVISFCVSSAGMLIVGLQLADVDFKELEGKLYAKLFALRTVAAAVIVGALILAEYLILNQLEDKDYKMLALVPLFPVAANVTVFASFLKTGESQSVLLVFLSTILSLVLVSLAVLFLF
ncbi:AEC family transporter [Dyadobacter sp.]|uniref:AEC family transporter n=1 Tax=Dyadobacter sp. TaxID=1914288 RepID=UPI003F6E99CB